MAEAIAALALAANILQVLGAGAKFAQTSWTLATAASYDLSDINELRHITVYLKPLLQHFQASQATTSDALSLTESDKQLRSLSTECSQLVHKLLRTLDETGVNDERNKLDSVVTAFKLRWKRTQIGDLTARINQLRDQLSLALLMSMRKQASRALEHQEAILQTLKQDSKYKERERRDQGPARGSQSAVEAPGAVMLNYLHGLLDSGHESERSEFDNIEDLILRKIYQRDGVGQSSNMGSDLPTLQMSPLRREEGHNAFIAALAYEEMNHRQSNIAEAHEATFKWVFEDRTGEHLQYPLVRWLESDDPLYWITGKAGSGKSTLMKFIGQRCEIDQGRDHLVRWAGTGTELLIASFYLWSAGAAVEASQKGLLQSLLHQLIQLHPELITEIMPSKWEAWCLFGSEIPQFRENELRDMLTTSIGRLVSHYGVKACFFIDGLDEFQGNHEDIIAICKSLLEFRNVKLCVSSRPLNHFEDAFGQKASLRLQDLTYEDILKYITARFAEDEGFNRLRQREPQYAQSFVKHIADKSSGVFLWVKLVVSSLLTGLQNDDRLSDLQRRLESLPRELEDLFQAIIDSLDPFYFKHASQYFKILQTHSGPPNALLFYFADVEDPRTLLDYPIRPASEDERQGWIATLRRRLNSRCKGLLEVTRSNEVQYLHRSVKDYLLASDVGRRVDIAAAEFDCNRQLCAAYLALLKRDDFEDDDNASRHRAHAGKCLIYAARVSGDKRFIIDALDCLETTVQCLNDSIPRMKHFYDMQPSDLFPTHRKLYLPSNHDPSFLTVTVRFGVVHYVDIRASRMSLAGEIEISSPRDKSKRSRLERIFRILSGQDKIPADRTLPFDRRLAWSLLLDACCCYPPNKEMFQCLLGRGADYNMVCDTQGHTVWEMVVRSILNYVISPGMCIQRRAWDSWVPILKLFHEHGAQMADGVAEGVIRDVLLARSFGFEKQPRLDRHALEGRECTLFMALECATRGREEQALELLKDMFI